MAKMACLPVSLLPDVLFPSTTTATYYSRALQNGNLIANAAGQARFDKKKWTSGPEIYIHVKVWTENCRQKIKKAEIIGNQ